MVTADKLTKKLETRRSFTYEPENSAEVFIYYIGDPTSNDIRKAEWRRAAVFTEALRDNLPTQAQMLELLKEKGVIDEAYEKDLEKTKIDLAAAFYRLENTEDQEELEAIALETSRLRDTLFRLNQRVNGPMGSCCENLAQNAQNEFLTSRVVQKEDGSLLWPEYENYINESDNKLVNIARFQVLMWMEGLDSDFLENLPENKVLNKIAQDRIKEVMDLAKEELEQEKTVEEKTVEDLKLPEEKKTVKKTRKPRKPRTIKPKDS